MGMDKDVLKVMIYLLIKELNRLSHDHEAHDLLNELVKFEIILNNTKD